MIDDLVVNSMCVRAKGDLPQACNGNKELCMQLMAEEAGISVDKDGFNSCMERQKETSRKARKTGSGAKLKFEAEAISQLQKRGIPATNDLPK